jgi:transposase
MGAKIWAVSGSLYSATNEEEPDMQIKSLRIQAYRSWVIDDTTPCDAIERLKQLDHFYRLKEQGIAEPIALELIDWSRATFYRWQKRFQAQGLKGLITQSRRPHQARKPEWSTHQAQQVLQLRRRFPAWGKLTLWRILTRDHHCTLSVSTVVRILAKAVHLGRIQPCAFYYGRVTSKRRRSFQHHAKRWRYKMQAKQPGELIQIDHMTVYLAPGQVIKEFKAVCPVSKQLVARAYKSATAHNGRDFLRALINDVPFTVTSIQVDGGSEFMAEFEAECARLNIPLYVLPPKRPQYNGCVERANGTSRSEFYPFYEGALTVAAVNCALADYQQLYNDYRPHQALDLLTPNEYLQSLMAA